MRFKGLDLNLLVAFDALMTERSLTAAARSIHLSQPAMSAAVARLRAYFRDDLFTMHGHKLVPTPLAEALAAPTREALLHIRLSMTERDTFDPAKSDRRFRVILSDFMALLFFRTVIARVAREAPNITFELVPFDDQPDEPLHRGEVDFLIFPEMYMSNAHPKAKLFDETLVCVGCYTNKQLSRKLTFDRYMSMGHVAAQFGRTGKPSIEAWLLLEHGHKRRVEVAVPSFSLIPPLLLGTERIATMHSRLARHFATTMRLRIVDLPIPLPAFTEAVQWPALHNDDQASIWMREIMLQEASRMAQDHKTSHS
ncbi:LysR family transcriptional regulator [Bradyrhizobium sp. CCGUVB1N3]|uniref:LysR family transcriptional regulator n=1 Tax=Bradyrhizobium sp. CCGUVB1N3 TaxID=2949629 RepID=UPI0020B39699|nr:LysR family transcriptional regulator [Bradyrhizobium sp. CCGUVB1N3]MCP3475852.1 LysR family transcriptional regulator [Bradyrhizobium sp. CCGUVB1N3]